MTDLEYRVIRMIRAVETGDENELQLLADEVGVTPLLVSDSKFIQAYDEMRSFILGSVGVPEHLLEWKP